MESKTEIRAFVRDLLTQKGEPCEITDDEPLVSAGLLDSLDVVTTVAFLEDRFGLDFSKRPFHADDFDTISSIAEIVSEWVSRPGRP